MGIAMQQPDSRYAAAPAAGYSMVYYDAKTGQLMMPNPKAQKGMGGMKGSEPRYIPVGSAGAGLFGNNLNSAPPSVDFNALPRQVPAGVQVYGAGSQAQPYQRPTRPTTPTGTGYRPQFDPTFIQQMLAQRFGNNQGAGIPTAARPTLTPGTVQNFGGYQGQGGLGALRAIANPAPAGGNENAPV